jgi:excisionase family DNA binding protein
MTMLTPPAVARQLRVHPEKVRAWILRGELSAFNLADRIGGRPRWRISEADLADFLRRRAASPGPRIRRRRRREVSNFIRYYS